jgi:tetratricopeptide (TPR) repeat protein
MYELKILSEEAIPSAMQKAERYRLLNEPYEAESICLDILRVQPENQEALILLILALTDRFGHEITPAFSRAQSMLDRLGDKHCRAYYGGIIFERRAKAHLTRGGPGSGRLAYEYFSKAMSAYEQALTTCSPGNQDAVLRWNTCARMMNENPEIAPDEQKSEVQMLDNWDSANQAL